ncbi:unnamed protein product [Calypogeia fissa]
MCCSDVYAVLGVEALRWVGSIVVKCINPKALQQKQCNKTAAAYGELENSTKVTPATLDYSDDDELLLRNIIVNPTFSEGTSGWSGVGCSISVRNHNGSYYCVAHGRVDRREGLAQEIGKRLDANVEYRVQAWVGIRGGQVEQALVQATIRVEKSTGGDAEYIFLDSRQVSKGEWCLLTGTLQLNEQPTSAIIGFNGPDGGIDVLVSSVAVVQTAIVPSLGVEKEDNNQRQIVGAKLGKGVADLPVLDETKLGLNVVANSNLMDGLSYWYSMGSCSLNILNGGPRFVSTTAQNSFVDSRALPPLSGKYIYSSRRTEIWEGPAQDITDQIQLYQCYQVFAWVATTLPLGSLNSSAPQKVNVALDVDGEWVNGGEILAGSEWTEVSGSFRLEKRFKKVVVYIQGPALGVDVKLSGLQIFAVDRLARVPLLQQQADKFRKRDMVLKLRNSQGRFLPPGTRVSIQQIRNSFPIGTCINHDSLSKDNHYREFFLENFNWAVFDYELKWDQVERRQGEVDYSLTDDMVHFCNDNDITMRGHCVVWGEEQWMQDWVKELEGDKLVDAVQSRVSSLLGRYRGQFKHYDVDNELLHSSFYQDRLGMEFLPHLFNLVHLHDPQASLFLNDYSVSDGSDCMSSPERYRDLVKFLLSNGAPVGGIGLQGHVEVPIGPIISRALNVLSTLNIPIWFTEIDTPSLNEHVRADDLEVMFREAFAHPSVEGVLLWGFMENAMSNENCHLVDADKRVNAAGQRLQALKREWMTRLEGIVGHDGELSFRGFHGDYALSVGNDVYRTFEVMKGDGSLVVDISI